MKCLLYLFISIVVFNDRVFAQSIKDSIYLFPEISAKFSDNEYALRIFMHENLHYPKAAIDSNIEGRVWVSFIVNKNGKLTDCSVLKSVNHDLDSEALRVIKCMPKWIPAIQKGEYVRSKYNLPIDFQLQQEPSRDTIKYTETIPEYEGDIMDFLSRNIRYPDDARRKGVQGKVLVRFVIDENGNVIEPEVRFSLYPSLDSEALRVVKLMDKWKPGMQNGKAVKVYYTIPVFFRLEMGAYDEGFQLVRIHHSIKIFEDSSVNKQPAFPGGENGLNSFLRENATITSLTGTILIHFKVNEMGKISDIKVLESNSATLYKETVRLIGKMPDWIPGEKNRKPAAATVTMQIRFYALQNFN